MTAPVSVSRFIPAPPEAIFDILATPSRHSEFDGSGSVKGTRTDGGRVGLGDEFGMSMHLGLSYTTRNVVTEFEEGRRIAWRTWAPEPAAKIMTGRTWRYELEPVDGGTMVTETWDPTTEQIPARYLLGAMAESTRRNMELTLRRLEDNFRDDLRH